MADASAAPPGPKAPRWAWWVATGFGSGYLKPAPGTWGSLTGLGAWGMIAWGWHRCFDPLLRAAEGRSFPRLLLAQDLFFLALLPLLTWLAVRACDAVVAETGAKDPAYLVADEWVGMWVALWPLRAYGPESMAIALPMAGLAFLWFRVFDILKPWPAFQLQELPAGQGVVADDLVAGLYALVMTEVSLHLLLALGVGKAF